MMALTADELEMWLGQAERIHALRGG
ncbi:hypothetical protein [Novosphingobium sp. NDB2Meth1]